jgi:hypothetical protein
MATLQLVQGEPREKMHGGHAHEAFMANYVEEERRERGKHSRYLGDRTSWPRVLARLCARRLPGGNNEGMTNNGDTEARERHGSLWLYKREWRRGLCCRSRG